MRRRAVLKPNPQSARADFEVIALEITIHADLIAPF
jgi:hypothetical protein